MCLPRRGCGMQARPAVEVVPAGRAEVEGWVATSPAGRRVRRLLILCTEGVGRRIAEQERSRTVLGEWPSPCKG
jgi:hypothetical protein